MTTQMDFSPYKPAADEGLTMATSLVSYAAAIQRALDVPQHFLPSPGATG